MKSGIAAAIKRITAPDHVRAEQTVEAFAPFASRDRYVAYMCKLHSFYARIEPRLFAWLGDRSRLKLGFIEHDLAQLGVDPPPLTAVRVPWLGSHAHALGVAYVLEGKTLGSRFLLEEARTKLDLDAGTGASFFAGYGPQTGAMWRAYLDTLTSHVAVKGGRRTIVHAARATFGSFTAWLTTSRAAGS